MFPLTSDLQNVRFDLGNSLLLFLYLFFIFLSRGWQDLTYGVKF